MVSVPHSWQRNRWESEQNCKLLPPVGWRHKTRSSQKVWRLVATVHTPRCKRNTSLTCKKCLVFCNQKLTEGLLSYWSTSILDAAAEGSTKTHRSGWSRTYNFFYTLIYISPYLLHVNANQHCNALLYFPICIEKRWHLFNLCRVNCNFMFLIFKCWLTVYFVACKLRLECFAELPLSLIKSK